MTENEIAALAALLRLKPEAQERVLQRVAALNRIEALPPVPATSYSSFPAPSPPTYAVPDSSPSSNGPLDQVQEALARGGKPECKKLSIDELEISSRSYNALKRAGLETIGDVAKQSRRALRELKGMGSHSMREVVEVMGNIGFELAP